MTRYNFKTTAGDTLGRTRSRSEARTTGGAWSGRTRGVLSSKLIILFLLMALGLVLQLHNLSNYNIYPDSYQSVTVAQNLKKYHSLVAPMGYNGLIYPDFFGWTRPLYPFLIVFFSFFGFSLIGAAHFVAVAAGALAILAAFGLVASVFKSPKYGLVGAALLAFSYGHAIWGGFVLTESLGVLMLTLAFWRLLKNSDKTADSWFANQDILTGAVFAAAILTRYEYIIPLTLASSLAGKKSSPKRTFSIILTFLAIVCFVLGILHPFSAGWAWTWGQINQFVYILLAILAAGLGFIICKKVFLKTTAGDALGRTRSRSEARTTGGAWSGRTRGILSSSSEIWVARTTAGVFVLGSLALAFNKSIYPGLWDWAAHDPLISPAALVGLVLLLLGKKQQRKLGLVLAAGLVVMGFSYYHINPTMERYATHLLPLLLIAASYGIIRLIKIRSFVIVIFVLALSLQFVKTWNGLHGVDHGIWFKTGYEEKSAKILKSRISPSDLLLTSMPEPYYLFTGNPTQSIADTPPFIFTDLPNSTQVVIVDDQGMRAIFPNFAKFIQTNLRPYQTSKYWVGEPLRYTTTITAENGPVIVYKITAGKLTQLINRQ